MPEPWNQKRIAGLTEMPLELLDATDLNDDEADTVCDILLPKLWQRSLPPNATPAGPDVGEGCLSF